MNREIYELLVPKSIKERIKSATIREYKEQEINKIRSVEESLPRADLSAVYIANLKVVTDNNTLLNAMPRGATIAEIGAGKGDLSSRILSITNPQKLHLIDKWLNGGYHKDLLVIIENIFHKEIETGKLVINPGTPLLVLEEFSNDYFDWIYLGDSDHSYENTTRLLEVCEAKVKEDGIISGGNYGLGSWLNYERYGVIEAINGFCKKNRWEMVYLTHESHRNLSYAMKKMS